SAGWTAAAPPDLASTRSTARPPLRTLPRSPSRTAWSLGKSRKCRIVGRSVGEPELPGEAGLHGRQQPKTEQRVGPGRRVATEANRPGLRPASRFHEHVEVRHVLVIRDGVPDHLFHAAEDLPEERRAALLRVRSVLLGCGQLASPDLDVELSVMRPVPRLAR